MKDTAGYLKIIYSALIISFLIPDFLNCSEINSDSVSQKYHTGLQKIFETRDKIKDLHPFLADLYPVAIVENNRFYVFDLDSSGTRYVFVKDAPVAWSISKEIRASFPLDFYDNRPACVTDGAVFDSPQGYATIFHEFIHCKQMNSSEQKIKQELQIYQNAMRKKNFMWELNHSFPYNDPIFTKIYGDFLQHLSEQDTTNIKMDRKALKDHLNPLDFEYMCWQEWKEGFARYIENKILAKLEIPSNNYGNEPPFNRIVFYTGGSWFIDYLISASPSLESDLQKLFEAISGN
ncbi:MAG: hypothetical protein AB7T22_09365 [Calditrichaceae bacterium]